MKCSILPVLGVDLRRGWQGDILAAMVPYDSCGRTRRWSQRWLVIGVIALALPGSSAESVPVQSDVPVQEIENGAASMGPYMRVQKSEDGTIALQIAVREFVPNNDRGPKVTLVAVSHVGETNYYRDLEALLNRQSLVLFEGVDFNKSTFRARQRQLQRNPEAAARDGSLQTVLAGSLDLAFQLDAINYDQAHFKNSDMSTAEIQSLMIRETEENHLDGESESNPEFLALMAAMEGSSWLGTFLHVGVKLLGTSPKLKAMTRLMLIEVLGGLRGDLSQLQGLPPDIQELLRVLIQARNAVVLRDLKEAMAAPERIDSMAVFYGAAHMDDMERRIRNELGYRPKEQRWMTALDVNPARAGLTDLEIQTIRGLVELQMKILNENAPQP